MVPTEGKIYYLHNFFETLDYDVLSILKMTNNEYSSEFVDDFFAKAHSHFYVDGIIGSPYFEGNISKDILLPIYKVQNY